jgi:hypothetical protein
VTAPLAGRWSALGYFDIGGFGLGSDLTWQALLAANYQATENLFLSIGWRHLSIDYSDRGTVLEDTMSGPVIGATWRF